MLGSHMSTSLNFHPFFSFTYLLPSSFNLLLLPLPQRPSHHARRRRRLPLLLSRCSLTVPARYSLVPEWHHASCLPPLLPSPSSSDEPLHRVAPLLRLTSHCSSISPPHHYSAVLAAPPRITKAIFIVSQLFLREPSRLNWIS